HTSFSRDWSSDVCSSDLVEFAEALKMGTAVAYKAVIKPVEGTILTVIREASDVAVETASQVSDLRDLLEYVVHTARDSVARTPKIGRASCRERVGGW